MERAERAAGHEQNLRVPSDQTDNGGWAALAVATSKYSGGEIVPSHQWRVVTTVAATADAVFNLGCNRLPQPAGLHAAADATYGWNQKFRSPGVPS
jgi:hypothetical protein